MPRTERSALIEEGESSFVSSQTTRRVVKCTSQEGASPTPKGRARLSQHACAP